VYFSIQTIYSECLDLTTSFSKNTGQKLLRSGAGSEYLFDNSELLTFLTCKLPTSVQTATRYVNSCVSPSTGLKL